MTARDDEITAEITAETVTAAAHLAGLPLDADRAAAVAGLLRAWVPAANALSLRMQGEPVRPLMPATVFGLPPVVEGAEP